MLDLGVIEPSDAEWSFPVVFVPKPDGHFRFFAEYRRLNERTVRDVNPITRTDDCLESLGDATVFSTLDCNSGCDGRTPGPHIRGTSSLPVKRGQVDLRHGQSDPVSPKRPLALAREMSPTDTYFESFRWRSTCDHPVARQPQQRSCDFPGTSKSPGRPPVTGQIMCKPDLDH